MSSVEKKKMLFAVGHYRHSKSNKRFDSAGNDSGL